jgi:uncharacterized protein (TIGR03437 family)
MDFHVFRIRSGVLLAVSALTSCMGTLQAANLLTATPASITLTCNTLTGPGPAANVVVKSVAATPSTADVTSSLTAALSVTPPAVIKLTAATNSTGLTFKVSAAPGCKGLVSGANPVTFRFISGATPDVTVTANITVTSTASPLVPSPSPVMVTCVSSPLSTPGTLVSVASAATGGTSFTVDSATQPPWLTVGTVTNSSATPATFNLSAASCTGTVGSSQSGTLRLLSPPAAAKLLPVTLMVVGSTPLTATATPTAANYIKNSGTPATWSVAVASSPTNLFFTVDTTTMPNWITVDSTGGSTTVTSKTLLFSTTGVVDKMAPGTYPASVKLKVSGYQDTIVSVTLTVKNPAATLSVADGLIRNLTWVVGQPLPTPSITAVSSDSPIAYTLTNTGAVANFPAKQAQGLAYSFGTAIPVTFKALSFAGAQPGEVLTGAVVLNYAATSMTVTFNIAVQTPGSTATLISISPTNLPTAVAGQTFIVTLYGAGFVPGVDFSQRTNVGIVSGGLIVTDPNVTANVVGTSTIILTIAVPSSDPYLNFSTSNSLTFGICNPSGGTCTTPTGTQTIVIGAGPIIQSITSASSFNALTKLAPYDIISIFGNNLCSSNGSGCASSILYGSPDPLTLTYPLFLSPDAGQRKLSVTFQTHGTTSTILATAPLLFATDNQINLLVPATGLPATGTVDIVVNFGTLKSAPQEVTVASTNPGLFTIDSIGNGAILNSVSDLNASGGLVGDAGSAAGMRTITSNSDIVQIYATGLGVPAAGSLISDPDTTCVSTDSYATFASLTSVDGAVMQSSLMNGHLPPCLDVAAVTVTIGGVDLVPTYVGWVPDAIAGLYQINVQLPAKGASLKDAGGDPQPFTAAVQLPVKISVGGVESQISKIWVKPRLTLVAPTTVTRQTGVLWPITNNAVTSDGSSTWTFTKTGVLPTGLTMDAAGVFAGTQSVVGDFPITVTGTDSSTPALSGSISFTITVTP